MVAKVTRFLIRFRNLPTFLRIYFQSLLYILSKSYPYHNSPHNQYQYNITCGHKHPEKVIRVWSEWANKERKWVKGLRNHHVKSFVMCCLIHLVGKEDKCKGRRATGTFQVFRVFLCCYHHTWVSSIGLCALCHLPFFSAAKRTTHEPLIFI